MRGCLIVLTNFSLGLTMKSAEIRQAFLDFFASKGHAIVASSPLIPGNDPTLLFTNAGMVQFKDVFLGQDKRAYQRATTAQRCVRAGGKHNDLENVGYTARHHTFFEMLGNFSFGDYFKRDAILYAWEFLTTVLKLPAEKLWVTVYASDDEAFSLWAEEVGVPVERIIRIGTSDNFWQMGDTGPCGPCSEIFYDHGEGIWGGPPGSPEEDGDRYIEIWNIVFMQYNRDENGTLHPLPKPSVDTGMGLERIAAVLQQVHSNYDIDTFQALIQAAARETGAADLQNPSLKVIADHIRACAFLITDGVIPSNEGRGYVLRRIIRRAIRHGYKLGQKGTFFYRLVDDLVVVMGEAYPELTKAAARVKTALQHEEERFAETLEHGMHILEVALSAGKTLLDGETIFKLYDTYGFPVDLTNDICRERHVELDETGFQKAMAAQRAQSRAASHFKMQTHLDYDGQRTTFTGYHKLENEAHVLALFQEGVSVESLSAGIQGVVVLDQTPFYAESGGQVGDQGELQTPQGAHFAVQDTQKIQPEVFGHLGCITQGTLKVGDKLHARVTDSARRRTAANHSATHLLHAALRQVLGSHVVQKGSLVNPERARFDFAHSQPVTTAELRAIEACVNAQICANHELNTRLMKHEEAIKAGAMALFGEKYGDEVRVVSMGSFSVELCGGIHVKRSGDIGLFKILSEGGVAAGVRRIEAVTGAEALAVVQAQEESLEQAAGLLKAQPKELLPKLGQTLEQLKSLEKALDKLKAQLAAGQGDALAEQALEIKGVRVLAAQLESTDSKVLSETFDQLREKLKPCVLVLANVSQGKVNLIAGVSNELTDRMKAGELVNFVAKQVGGKGGGKPDLARAGGTDVSQLTSALASVSAWVEQH